MVDDSTSASPSLHSFPRSIYTYGLATDTVFDKNPGEQQKEDDEEPFYILENR
jgi:hypothetical protein